MIKLLTEKEFEAIRKFKNYECYRKEVRKASHLTIEAIIAAIETVMGDQLKLSEWLTVNDRHEAIMYARHYGRYIANRFSQVGDTEIARAFGGRDRTVIYNSLNVIQSLQEGSPDQPRLVELTRIIQLLNERYRD